MLKKLPNIDLERSKYTRLKNLIVYFQFINALLAKKIINLR